MSALPGIRILLILTALLIAVATAWGQVPSPAGTAVPAAAEEGREVGVVQVARDEQIAARLEDILAATGWFEEPGVTVRNGVVFLQGVTRDGQNREWATRLAQRTEDVVAVVNRIEVLDRPLWDVTPALDELGAFWRQIVQIVPLLGVGLLLLVLVVWASRRVARLSVRLLGRRVNANPLLLEVARTTILVLALLFGLFLMLRVAGLSRLALTLAGGTGIAGLVIGIALRDIAENFLASLLLSVQRPFRTGDLIEVEEHLGYVQRVTTRGTLLMTFEGVYVQIPNAAIYKSTIRNYTANPNQRLDFRIGIGYDTAISRAQEVGLAVLRQHPAILDDPEPMILVEEFGASTVNLRVYFWVDTVRHSVLRVKSAAMRLLVRAYQEAGISLPDEARELLFPQGVPVRMLDAGEPTPPTAAPTPGPDTDDAVSTAAEGALDSEAGVIRSQASRARLPEAGRNILEKEEPAPNGGAP